MLYTRSCIHRPFLLLISDVSSDRQLRKHHKIMDSHEGLDEGKLSPAVVESDDSENSEYIPTSEIDSDDSVEFPVINVTKGATTSTIANDGSIQVIDGLMNSNFDLTSNDHTHRQKIHQKNNFQNYTNSAQNVNIPENETNHVEPIETSSDRRLKKHHKSRPCLFCGKFQTNLRRHILLKHNKEENVKRTCELPKKDQDECFEQMRKEGIMKYNKEEMRKQQPIYERERAVDRGADALDAEEIVACGKCSGIYARKYFGRHKNRCIAESVYVPKPLPMDLLKVSNSEVSEDFKVNILSRFMSDTVGQMCRSDSAIITFGSRLYEKLKRKKDKQAEVKKSVMTDMRRIAALYTEFKSRANTPPTLVGSEDMLIRRNFSVLTESIFAYTLTDTEETKAGLKNALFYLIKKFAKIQKAVSLMNDNDQNAAEIDKFLEVLSLNGNFIFGDATYTLNRNRQTKLRKPDKLPLEEDVEKIRKYTVERIASIVSDSYVMWDLHLYAELRDLAVSRLTLFNGRRGGEPARLLLSEWKDAESGTWLNPARIEKLPETEALLFKSMLITYQGGKGNNHLVPVLIPNDSRQAMRLLSDPHIRQMSGVHCANRYMFPCTQESETHVGTQVGTQ
jgi:hypothetical protein